MKTADQTPKYGIKTEKCSQQQLVHRYSAIQAHTHSHTHTYNTRLFDLK